MGELKQEKEGRGERYIKDEKREEATSMRSWTSPCFVTVIHMGEDQ